MILRGDSLSFPASSTDLFGRDAPMILEIGFGNGDFLAELSQSLPEHNLLGVEKAMTSVTHSFVRLRRREASNVRLMHAYAQFTLREVLAPGSLQRVYVNFPDPWPRIGHRRRRLIQQPLLWLLSSRLMDGGDMIFTSDHEEYFNYTLKQGERCDCFDVSEQEASTEYLSTKYATAMDDGTQTNPAGGLSQSRDGRR